MCVGVYIDVYGYHNLKFLNQPCSNLQRFCFLFVASAVFLFHHNISLNFRLCDACSPSFICHCCCSLCFSMHSFSPKAPKLYESYLWLLVEFAHAILDLTWLSNCYCCCCCCRCCYRSYRCCCCYCCALCSLKNSYIHTLVSTQCAADAAAASRCHLPL